MSSKKARFCLACGKRLFGKAVCCNTPACDKWLRKTDFLKKRRREYD